MFFLRRDAGRRVAVCELAGLPVGVLELADDFFGRFPNGDLDCVEVDLNAPSLCLFINHAEQANCEYVTDDTDDWCETTRDIKAGEEILRDYLEDGSAVGFTKGGE